MSKTLKKYMTWTTKRNCATQVEPSRGIEKQSVQETYSGLLHLDRAQDVMLTALGTVNAAAGSACPQQPC